MHRSFKTNNIATLGWNLPLYWEKYGEWKGQPLSSFCKSLKEIQLYLESANIKIELVLCSGLTVFPSHQKRLLKTLKELSVPNIGVILFETRHFSADKYYLYNFKTSETKIFPTQLFANAYGSGPDGDPITQNKVIKLQNELLRGKRSFNIALI